MIINADDFGWNPSNDLVIKDLITNRHVTSATLMVNGQNRQWAAQFHQFGNFSLGLHLNLTEGKPISPNVPSLVNEDGTFFGKFRFRDRISQITKKDIKTEIRGQISMFVELVGRLPSHIDGHQHVHVIHQITQELAPIMTQEFGIYKVRLINEKLLENQVMTTLQIDFYQQVIEQSKISEAIFKKYHVFSTDGFLGLNIMGKMFNQDYILENVEQHKTYEWMCHPGQENTQIGDEFYRSSERSLESQNIQQFNHSLRLINFHQLTRNEDLTKSKSILIYSQMIQGTGNYTMSLRFKRIFEKQNYRVLLRSIAGFNIEMKDSCKREIEDLSSFCKQEQIKLIYGVNLYRTGIMIHKIQKITPIPYFLVIAGTDANVYLKNNIYRKKILKAIQGSTMLISLNEKMKLLVEDDLKKESFNKEIVVIPQSVEIDQLDEDFSLKNLLSLSKDSVLIILPASIRKIKDICFALNPLKELFQKYLNYLQVDLKTTFLLLLVLLWRKIIQTVQCNFLISENYVKYQNFKFISLLDSLPQSQYLNAIINEASLILNTSIAEGLSSSILEAQKYSLPVLVRANEGNLSIIENEFNGLVFYDEESFKLQYYRIFNDIELKVKLITNGKLKFDQKYNNYQNQKIGSRFSKKAKII